MAPWCRLRNRRGRLRRCVRPCGRCGGGSRCRAARARQLRWPEGLALRVRMGIHTGETHERGADYFGPAVNRAARVMDVANGTQILVSAATREILQGEHPQVERWVELGFHDLRDVSEPVRLYRVEDARLSRATPAHRGLGTSTRGTCRHSPCRSSDGPTTSRRIVSELDAARVVTLTGVGGVGKTRLALEVGRVCSRRSPEVCGSRRSTRSIARSRLCRYCTACSASTEPPSARSELADRGAPVSRGVVDPGQLRALARRRGRSGGGESRRRVRGPRAGDLAGAVGRRG